MARHRYCGTMRGIPNEVAPRELRDEDNRTLIRWWSYSARSFRYAYRLADIPTAEIALRTEAEIAWIRAVLGEDIETVRRQK